MAFETESPIGVRVIPFDKLQEIESRDAEEIEEEAYKSYEYDALAGFIIKEFDRNRQSRIDSGIEDIIKDSVRAYNGEYSDEDKAKIADVGGSNIFMNITATKSRAAKSWIADVLKPPDGDPWALEPTPIEDLPADIKKMVETSLNKEFEEMVKTSKATGTTDTEAAQESVREINQRRRDVQTAVAEEITAESKHQLSRMEKKIKDQLVEGNWDKALLDFINDFVVYPTAFMKGPVISKKKKLVWANGVAVETEKYVYMNERVDPLDMYPSPEATCINDGNLCEHIRLSKEKLRALKGVEEYKEGAIEAVLRDYADGNTGSWVDTGIEQEKADAEKRGSFIINNATIHGIHFHGYLQASEVKMWEFYTKDKDIEEYDDNDILDVEAILVGNHVIKCIINQDPLKRRPYYKASFMDIPGSFWGRSLPMLMSPQQRMCNAVARALSNNLGISSGPQIELYVERLADAGDISEITPNKIWQLKSDPTGAGGRAIQFWQPDSNAEALLKVYKDFEEKADDVTGIPKYAYGNERTAGATQTAQGLAMLLESTSKIIKDCIRNIDEGLIKPRILFQFYHNMENNEDFKYSGDINVVTIGSATLSIRGAEATKRNEFLQATANPTDLGVMGVEGRAAILRKMAGDLGLPTSIVPSAFELKRKLKKQEEQQAAAAKAQAQAEQAKAQAGIQATKLQVDGQAQMHQTSMQVELQKLQAKMKKDQEEIQVKIADIQRKMQEAQAKAVIAASAEDSKVDMQNKEIAVKLQKGSGI